jgi:hypothetical protein
MREKSIKYKDWDSGKEKIYNLSNSNPYETISNLICPFDDTSIVRWHDQTNNKGYNCPNCGLEYKISSGLQENINNFAKKYYGEKIHKRIADLEKEKSKLSKILNHAVKQGISE